MDFTLSANEHTPIEFRTEALSGLPKNCTAGLREYQATGDFGNLLFCEQAGDGFSVWHKQYNIKQPVTITETQTAPTFQLCVAVSGPFLYQQAGLGKYTLPEGQFNILFTPQAAQGLYLEKGKKCILYEIRFPGEWLQKLMPWFGLLPDFLMKAGLGLPCQLNPSPSTVTPAMMSILHKILHAEGEGTVRNMYLEALLTDLLLQAVTRLTPAKMSAQEIKVQPYEQNKLREAWEYLLRNLDRPGTMTELSHAIGLNEFKLKRGFKQVYGKTIFEFLLEARMEKATRLLQETNMTVHAVGLAVGYKNISSFTVAFKKKFHLLPSDVKGRA